MILEDQIESQMMKVEYFLTNSIYLYFEETKVDLEKEENELFKKKKWKKEKQFVLPLFISNIANATQIKNCIPSTKNTSHIR